MNKTDDNIFKVVQTLNNKIQISDDLKIKLTNLDNELGYLENVNDSQLKDQSQFLKANEHEYMLGKDNTVKI